jgi:hypothetical protein
MKLTHQTIYNVYKRHVCKHDADIHLGLQDAQEMYICSEMPTHNQMEVS